MNWNVANPGDEPSLDDRSQNAGYLVRQVALDEIHVKSGRRRINEKKVKGIAASVRRIGLQNPITVYEWRPGKFRLVAGEHRLEAFKLLKEQTIPAFVLGLESSRAERLQWEDEENLQRAEPTVLELAEAVARLVKRLLEASRATVQPGGRQKHDRGISKAARALGMSNRAVGRALDIAGIAPRVKQVIGADLADRDSALLDIAKLPTAKEQLAKVLELSKPSESSSPASAGTVPKAATRRKKAKASIVDWYGLFRRKFPEAPLGMRLAYARLSPAERSRFAREELS
jgi:ParB family transcriptional regulator, chromosome partitioning protein